ncbi:DUF4974 domain-containing protein [Chitinophaga silvatica]|uniref:DUF4974 domain-containing protein n=1 Tax=Chitinophaga silvatica TaxID=2282649 RepID=A0A3E1YGT0_9BACT|nr:FecR domain-containing protein [Chitinophaga silvatica]RFS26572.1 DUF4974 domain-containing protein [Chitinophaga silvatica]
MGIKDYQQYELADFLADEDFKNWTNGNTVDLQLNAHWEKIKIQFPEKAVIIEEARGMVNELRYLPVFPSAESHQRVWNQINKNIEQSIPHINSVKWFRFAYRYAAAIVGLGVLTVGLTYYNKQQAFICKTGFGKDTTFFLPDGSKVMLAANSEVIYRTPKNPNQLREIWLKGEAYFDILPVAHNSFTVHIDGGVDVRVLGTAFLVKNRHGQTSVSLDNGKIQVQMPGVAQHLLQPGETVVADTKARVITKQITSPAETREWKGHNILLQETTVKEIIAMFKDYYNKELIISDPILLEKKVDGMLPSNNETQALKALSVILNAEITVQDTIIQLKVRN